MRDPRLALPAARRSGGIPVRMPLWRVVSAGPFRHDPFRLLFFAASFASLAGAMQQFAIGWLAVELAISERAPERAAFYVGLVGLAQFVPALVFGLIGSVAADRFDRGRILVVSRVASFALALVLGVTVISGSMSILVLMPLTALAATSLAFEGPSRLSIVPFLVPARDMFQGLGGMRSMTQTATVVGPLLGGLLVLRVGLGELMLFVAVLFGVSAAGLRRLPPVPAYGNGSTGTIGALTDGLAYVRDRPTLRNLLGIVLVFSVLGSSYLLLLPAVVHDVLGAGALALSLLASASGVGAILGAIAAATMGGWAHPGRVLILTSGLFAGALLVFGGLRELAMATVASALLGFLHMLLHGIAGNALQQHISHDYRGRVIGMHSTLYMSGIQLGAFLLGSVASIAGIGTAFVGAGVGLAAVALLMCAMPVIRELAQTRTEKM